MRVYVNQMEGQLVAALEQRAFGSNRKVLQVDGRRRREGRA